MKIYKYKFLSDAYKEILDDLLNRPEFTVKPRDQEVREILNCVIEIEEPCQNLYINEVRSSKINYVAAEILWYFSGTNKADFIEKHAVMWTQIKNKNNELNSAYGNLLFEEKNKHRYTQYRWVIETLKKDKDSRQAFMHFNRPKHQFLANKDQVCTLVALFHIRNNKLYMTLTMRSNDIIKGFSSDFVFFNMLHQHVYLHLKEYYPELQMGSYTHISHSMHLYDKQYNLVENMLKHEFKPDAMPLLNTSIIEENGSYKKKYDELFESVIFNQEIIREKTDNNVLNWCLEHLK